MLMPTFMFLDLTLGIISNINNYVVKSLLVPMLHLISLVIYLAQLFLIFQDLSIPNDKRRLVKLMTFLPDTVCIMRICR